MKIRLCLFSLFLGMVASASAWGAPPAADFKAMMRKTLDAWETLDPANAAPFYDQNPDNVYFDTTPLKYTGWVAYAEGVKNNFPDLASVKFTLGDDVRIHPHENLTWATATLHFDLTTKGGAKMPLDGRWTLIWEKQGANWLIVHEHVSAPLPVPPNTAGLPLYKRLGGYDTLAAVADDFLPRMVKDPQLGKYFVGQGTDSLKRIRQLLVDQLCVATGGPCHYLGRPMRTVHAGLRITDNDWDIAVDHLIESLLQFKVADKERDDLLAVVAGLKKEVVVSDAL